MESNATSKKVKLTRVAEPPDESMTFDAILARVDNMRARAHSHIGEHAWVDDALKANVEACDAIRDILTVLQREGVRSLEQVQELIDDHNRLYRKLEVAGKPDPHDGMYFCPWCHKRNQPGNNHCWYCGKLLDWE